MWATRIGCKGSFIYSDYWDIRQDSAGEAVFGLSLLDDTRGTFAKFNGPQARTFVRHRNKLYMLQADGKFLEVLPGGLVLRKDLKRAPEMKSPWASGILGGSLQKTPLVGAGQFPVPRVARPFVASFGDELHAFLNYEITSSTLETQTGFPVAKGNQDGNAFARGIAWFTSHDGINWADRTSHLGAVGTMASGIITPSGNQVQETAWLQTIAPYRFSSFQTVPFPSGYGSRAGHPDSNSKFGGSEASQQTGATAPIVRGSYEESVLEPSGYRQATGRRTETVALGHRFGDQTGLDLDRLPFWSSGAFIDPANTPFDQLKIKLNKGAVSGYMYPTLVDYPSGFDYVDPAVVDGATKPGVANLLAAASGGVWAPWGQGARGWDFTGVGWRHVAGFVESRSDNENDYRLRLAFSRNPAGSTDNASKQTETHFWELDRASGWHQINYAHWGGAIHTYQPVDLDAPEVIIPSGSLDDPNPVVNPTEGHLRVRFNLVDWGFWDQVNMKFEYSLNDGFTWADATVSGSLGPLGTNNKQADPSGLFGEEHEIFWLYPKDIGTDFSALTRIRMRAEAT